ncbi:hypothetical protein RF55_982 [Lasius niger]|uniref:Uncharacterized protein n=1 Tax=Lasius niger TaxID=67767 RepID=A0A0J7L896_LASNI|nr:hypothetical protein RF55_1056 [Lasius niger]KMR01325.1 hypothetical protein RF55_982 [Lasius niger]
MPQRDSLILRLVSLYETSMPLGIPIVTIHMHFDQQYTRALMFRKRSNATISGELFDSKRVYVLVHNTIYMTHIRKNKYSISVSWTTCASLLIQEAEEVARSRATTSAVYDKGARTRREEPPTVLGEGVSDCVPRRRPPGAARGAPADDPRIE